MRSSAASQKGGQKTGSTLTPNRTTACRHDDVGFRIHATRQLPRIARALGAERTREELIPFVTDSTDDEDEVLLALAETIGHLNDGHVGGEEHLHLLLLPLEALTACEEGAVRERAVASIRTVTEAMPKQR